MTATCRSYHRDKNMDSRGREQWHSVWLHWLIWILEGLKDATQTIAIQYPTTHPISTCSQFSNCGLMIGSRVQEFSLNNPCWPLILIFIRGPHNTGFQKENVIAIFNKETHLTLLECHKSGSSLSINSGVEIFFVEGQIWDNEYTMGDDLLQLYAEKCLRITNLLWSSTSLKCFTFQPLEHQERTKKFTQRNDNVISAHPATCRSKILNPKPKCPNLSDLPLY